MLEYRSLKEVFLSVIIAFAAILSLIKVLTYQWDPIYRITNATTWSVVRIANEMKTAGGTAFAVKAKSGNMFLVTNDHVCLVASSDTMTFSLDSVNYTAKIIEHYELHDLCLLKVQEKSTLKSLEVAVFKPNYDDKVYSAGYPMMPYLTVFEGQYKGPVEFSIPIDIAPDKCKGEKYDSIEIPGLPSVIPGVTGLCILHGDAVLTTLHADFGSSGSPLLNSSAQVVGVIFITRGNTSLGAAVPLEFLQDLLDKH